MTKIALLLALTILAFVQGKPGSKTQLSDAVESGNWELFHKLIQENFHNDAIWKPKFVSSSVRNLSPPPGGHVYGESEYTFHSASDVNGKKEEKSGGHKIINDDGKVTEYDIKPKSY